jgi:GNAT superfamily N-acetyltransferase
MADIPDGRTWRIELLTQYDDRRSFTSGQPLLDDFLRHRAGQYDRRDVGRTYVLVAADDLRVRGYYTLAARAMGFSTISDEWSKRLPPHHIPTVHLGRLAVDEAAQGMGLGGDLLLHALRTAVRVAEEIGVYAVDVFAIDENAKSFYQRFGFLQLEDDPFHPFLPVKLVRQLM